MTLPVLSEMKLFVRAMPKLHGPIDALKIVAGRSYKMRDEVGTYTLPDKWSMWCFTGVEESIRKTVSDLREGVFVDVGANFGWHTILAAKNGNTVYAIEPGPAVLPYLRANVDLNQCSDVHIFSVAAWDRDGDVSFAQKHGTVHGKTSDPTPGSALVRGMRLDNILAGVVPDIVKIDVEGSELRVLRGMEKTLREAREMRVIFEVLNPQIEQECSSYLLKFGFRTEMLEGANRIALRT